MTCHLLLATCNPTLIKEVLILLRKMSHRRVGIQRHPQARLIPNFDEAVLDDGVRQPLNNFSPPRLLRGWTLKSDVVIGQRSAHVNLRRQADEAVKDAMRRD